MQLPGSPDIDVTLRRSARARRLSLRVSQLDGRVTLTLPRGVAEAEGLRFLRSKEAWLRGHLEARDPRVVVRPGATIPLEGTPVLLAAGTGRGVAWDGTDLRIPADPARAGAALRGWLRARARDRLSAASDRHAARLGRDYARLTLRDTRSRWGSCTADGGLMYSWRLILAPPDVLDYVAAHEVAHLAHMHHGPAFWDAVESLYGDWRPARRWLSQNGAALHRYDFDAAD